MNAEKIEYRLRYSKSARRKINIRVLCEELTLLKRMPLFENLFENCSDKVVGQDACIFGQSLFWYLSLFVICKAWHQYNERPRALA